MTASMEDYIHTPLTGETQIRVIKLLPSSKSDLHCELMPVSLGKLPDYEALSYSWDSQEASREVICHGKRLQITPNCEAALRRLRLPTKARLLWIDSICIDQKNLIERRQQVKHMGEVYGQAKRVVVWLGESTPQSDMAIKYLKKFFSIGAVSRVLPEKSGSIALEREISKIEKECKDLMIPNATTIDAVMQDLFSRSWFSRLWTIQEVALSKIAIVICGAEEIPFHVLVEGSKILAAAEHKPWAENPLMGRGLLAGSVALHARMVDLLDKHHSRRAKLFAKSVNAIFSSGKKPVALTRSAMLRLAHDRNATEPRDKVFALYGLYDALKLPIIIDVDYERPLEDIYWRETITAFQEDANLDVFYNITGTGKLSRLPSWVPDWSDTSSPRCTATINYAAAGPSSPRANLLSDGISLRLPNIRIIGTIQSVAEKTMPRLGAMKDFNFKKILPTVQNWAAFCDPGFTGEVNVGVKRKGYYRQEWFEATDFCSILVRGCAPFADPYGDVDLTQSQVITPNAEHMAELKRMGSVWFPIACSATTEVLYSRLTGYPESIVSDDIMIGISNALEGTPSARTYHRLVEVMSEGLKMFKTETGFFGTSLPNIQVKDEVALIAGLRMPFILRPGNQGYKILGPAYVQDVMLGEYWSDEPTPETFSFIIV